MSGCAFSEGRPFGPKGGMVVLQPLTELAGQGARS
jgi:hypothetical protein